MTEILTIGYGNSFALEPGFDLNQLRRLHPVEEVKGNYVPAPGHSDFYVTFNKTLIVDDAKIEESKLAKAEEDKENYRRWWSSEQEKTRKLQSDLDCLKLQLQEMSKSE